MHSFSPEPRIGTSMGKMGRVADIEHWNGEMRGLLSVYARLPAREQADMMRTVKSLKAETPDSEVLLERLRALAMMYGSVSRDLDPKSESMPAALTWRLGEVERTFTEHQDKQKPSTTIH